MRKMSCTTRWSSIASASRAWSTSGSDIAGFSPMMYMPRISPFFAAFMISTTVRPGFGSSSRPQSRSKRGLRLRVVDALVVRIHHRDQPGVGGTLHVVLPAQRMETGARAADLAGDERERDQAARVVGAVDVLRDPHAPQDHRALRGGVEARHLADRLGRDAADRRHLLRRVLLDVLAQRLVVRRAVADERLVDEALLDDRVEHRVEQRDVGVGIELQEMGRVPGEIGPARVGDDQLHAALRRVLHPGRRDRMVAGRVRADDEHDFGLRHVAHLVRHRARVDAFHQRGDARGVAEARAVIDVVRAEAGAHQLLEEIRLLVRALRRAEPGERARAVPVADRRAVRSRRGRAPPPTSPRGTRPASGRDRRRSPSSSARRACGPAASSAAAGG